MDDVQDNTLIPDWPRGVTFEEVWASMKENALQMKELRKIVKETQKSIGGLSGSVGTMAEGLLVPNLKKKFQQFGFSFEVLSPHRKIFNDDNTIKIEIDALLENAGQAMAVETKLTCKRGDIDYHLKRMEKIREYADSHGDKRPYFGAIASPVIDEDTKRYALQNGLYVIELSGENADIIKPDVEKVW